MAPLGPLARGGDLPAILSTSHAAELEDTGP